MYSLLLLDVKKTFLTSYHYTILENNAKDKILLQTLCEPFDDEILQTENLLVLADTDDAIATWTAKKIPVIAWSHEKNKSESLMGSPYMILSLDALTLDYLEEIYCRDHGLPLTIVKTKRSVLRELTADDYTFLLALDDSQPEDSAGRFFPYHLSKAEKADYLRQYIKSQYPFYGFGIYGAFHRESQEFLGIAGFATTESSELEVGYAVKKSARQKGYAFEWVSALIDYARETLCIQDIVARISEDNLASLRLARKCSIRILTISQSPHSHPLQ
ncbi:MAG: GNAT family N-acetyltransferase [Eubacteriales bacterium]|nr:GNAT family N-acetyltransferase [Eubacteriales bacterium]